MKKLTLIPLSLLLLAFALTAFADFSEEDWLFYKGITLPEALIERGPLAIKLDDEVFASIRSDFGDLRIIESDKNEIPFGLIKREEEEMAGRGEIINPSSVRYPFRGESFGPSKIIDGDIKTYFQNDYLEEPERASFTIDLKKAVLTRKIAILSTDSANTWKSIKIEGSNDLKDWQIIKEKTLISFSPRREIIYPESFYRYLKLTFEHTGSLKIHEIEVYSASEVFLLFLGEEAKEYKLYYGNDLATMPAYKMERLLLENAYLASLSTEYVNPKGKADYDKDGVSNEIDNCPFVSNSSQLDSDQDGIGDNCDNCPTFKNPNQLDKNNNGVGDVCEDDDKDGIVNILDNCPDYPNANQKDENKNGVGDDCEDFDGDRIINAEDNCINDYNYDQRDKDKDGIGDACDPKDDRWTEKAPYLLWATIAIVIGVIVFFAIRLLKKMGQI